MLELLKKINPGYAKTISNGQTQPYVHKANKYINRKSHQTSEDQPSSQNKQTNQQTNQPTNKQTNKPTNKQRDKHEGKSKTNKQTKNKQTSGNEEFIFLPAVVFVFSARHTQQCAGAGSFCCCSRPACWCRRAKM